MVLIWQVIKSSFTDVASFYGWNIFGSFAYMIKDQGLNMLLNLFFGPIVNAARAVSYQVSSALNGFSTNVFTAFRPQLIQSYSSMDYSRTNSLMFMMSKFVFFLMVLIAFPVIIEIDYILDLWLGGNVPTNTALFTVIVILNMLVTNFNPPISQVVHATGKMSKYQIITSLVLTSILPISWIFLHYGFPAETVFWTSLFVSVLNQLICLIILKEIFEYSLRLYFSKVLMPCLLISIVIFPTIYFVHILMYPGFVRLLCVFGANLLLSLSAIYYLGLTKTEKYIIKNKLRIIQKK